MRLEDLNEKELLRRPEDNKHNVDDGAYSGRIVQAELVERDSQYTEDGKRVVLNFKVELDSDGDHVTLYHPVNYTWSKRGKMIHLLDKIGCLPQPGESLDFDNITNTPVQIIVENVEKDGEVYSNIVSMKKDANTTTKAVTRKPKKKTVSPLRKKSIKKEAVTSQQATSHLFDENDDELEEDISIDLEDDDIDLDDI